jgi:hypothetical protein
MFLSVGTSWEGPLTPKNRLTVVRKDWRVREVETIKCRSIVNFVDFMEVLLPVPKCAPTGTFVRSCFNSIEEIVQFVELSLCWFQTKFHTRAIHGIQACSIAPRVL